jgi:hypothetical protein
VKDGYITEEIGKKIKEINEEIEKYCNELGIDIPF